MDPVHEEGVGDFEFDRFWRERNGDDRLEPGFECLLALQTPAHTQQNLIPDADGFRGLLGNDGHFNVPC